MGFMSYSPHKVADMDYQITLYELNGPYEPLCGPYKPMSGPYEPTCCRPEPPKGQHEPAIGPQRFISLFMVQPLQLWGVKNRFLSKRFLSGIFF